MPLWPSRSLHPSQAASGSPTAAFGLNYHPRNLEEGTDLRPGTLSPDKALQHQTSHQRRHHNRSISHPLHSVFGHGRKADKWKDDYNKTKSPEFDAQDVLHNNASEGFAVMPNSSKQKAPVLELVSGKCTICLMVNDVWSPEERSHELAEIPKLAVPSLRTTEAIINECVLLYLQSLFDTDDATSKMDTATNGVDFRTSTNAVESKESYQGGSADLRRDTTSFPFLGDKRKNRHLGPGGQYLSSHVPLLSKSLPIQMPEPELATMLGVDGSVAQSTSLPLGKQAVPQGQERQHPENTKCNSVFRPLENYIIRCFRSCDNLSNAFRLARPTPPKRCFSDGPMLAINRECGTLGLRNDEEKVFEPDAKTLLLGDVAENGTWWSGSSHRFMEEGKIITLAADDVRVNPGNQKSPRTNWTQLHQWYQIILNAGNDWQAKLPKSKSRMAFEGQIALEATIKADIERSRIHLCRTLLKATESLLRRPRRPLRTSEDSRFLLLLLANPLLYSLRYDDRKLGRDGKVTSQDGESQDVGRSDGLQLSSTSRRKDSQSHIGIIKRILGLISNLPHETHRHMIYSFAQYSTPDFQKLVDLVGRFVTHRLVRKRSGHPGNHLKEGTSVLVPEISDPGQRTPAQLHAALNGRVRRTNPANATGDVLYGDDWQIIAAAKVMSLLSAANTSTIASRQLSASASVETLGHAVSSPRDASDMTNVTPGASRNVLSRASPLGSHTPRQLVPTSAFYNTLLDQCDLISDFENWEKRAGSFSFCQYPMFLSIWAKIRILEHDTRRQMEIKARQAFFDSIVSRRAISQYLVIRIRRDCLVEDSLRGVSEVVGSGQEDIKKALRITFQGEEGVDAGGTPLEAFGSKLMVPIGMFVYDDESHYCYFNPDSFETSDQFFLVGVVLGLAIYNSTILDVALPPLVFRKLLACAPNYTGPATFISRPSAVHTLDDLAEFRRKLTILGLHRILWLTCVFLARLALGLQQLLEFDGDVEQIFCRDFVIECERYGHLHQIPLLPNGENIAVTNANRVKYVELYVRYLLEVSVSRQFEPFKRGFFSVCGGNALSLFRPEEIELLVCGSDEPLDVSTLQSVAISDGWNGGGSEDEAVMTWFWELFAQAAPRQQRALLSFITGSDRLPAMGATSLIIKVTCLGDNAQRYPIARTCFNMIGLYRYPNKKVLQNRLWRAVAESEGFGLK
ncbi:MAG: hypothetical protein Q9222_002462 [Ikaeria aurantiellina]